jgi:hypothetical protein
VKLPVKAKIVKTSYNYTLEISDEIQGKWNNTNPGGFTFKNNGTFPVILTSDGKIDCGVTEEVGCSGETQYNVSNGWQTGGDKCPNCAITGSGKIDYRLTGIPDETMGRIIMNLVITKLDPNWKMSCTGCPVEPLPDMGFVSQWYYVGDTSVVEFDKSGGKQCSSVSLGGYLSGSQCVTLKKK